MAWLIEISNFETRRPANGIKLLCPDFLFDDCFIGTAEFGKILFVTTRVVLEKFSCPRCLRYPCLTYNGMGLRRDVSLKINRTNLSSSDVHETQNSYRCILQTRKSLKLIYRVKQPSGRRFRHFHDYVCCLKL